MTYDLAIVGGTVVDGSGRPGYRADVGISRKRVADVGALAGPALERIDATGRIVAPGFIDIHTHYDAQIRWDPWLSISPWHGVTSVVIGNCGFGVAPTRAADREGTIRTLEKVEGMDARALHAGLGADWGFEGFPEYLDALEHSGCAINVAALLPHTNLRTFVLGPKTAQRPAEPAEVARMQALLREALEAGALGVSTSKAETHVGEAARPVASRFAELSELQALADVLAEAGSGLLQVAIGKGLFLEELAELAQRSGRPVSWTALLSGVGGPGAAIRTLRRSAELSRRGAAIHPQVACKSLDFDYDFREPFMFESLSIFGEVSQTKDWRQQTRSYRDPEFRRRFLEATGPEAKGFLHDLWRRTVVSHCPADPSLEERSVAELARERNTSPVDLALDLAIASDLEARFRSPFFNVDQDEVEQLLVDPHTILGLSDAGAHASQLCDAGFATHLLGHWVREKHAVTLEQAVRMLTTQVAEVFGLADRGRLAPGRPADVVVFDAERVGSSPLRRVFDLPGGAPRLVSDAVGIETVIVNGTPIRRGGRDVQLPEGVLPGRLLRHGRAAG